MASVDWMEVGPRLNVAESRRWSFWWADWGVVVAGKRFSGLVLGMIIILLQ